MRRAWEGKCLRLVTGFLAIVVIVEAILDGTIVSNRACSD